MDATREFNMKNLIFIGLMSGLAVSLVKLIQAGFHLGGATSVEVWAAVFTYGAYCILGAIGAVFLVDHDHKGQKMLKSAFLMGFVAPSFFLALLSQPVNGKFAQQELFKQIPKISFWGVNLANAQSFPADKQGESSVKLQGATPELIVLDKADVQPRFSDALLQALGARAASGKFTYVVGAATDEKKALSAADELNRLLAVAGSKVSSTVVQPKGLSVYYLTLGGIGSQETASASRDAGDKAIIRMLELSNQGKYEPESKRAASLLVRGQVVDARIMFSKPD